MDQLESEILKWAGADSALKLAGDASTRRFYRVQTRSGPRVVMVFADDAKSRGQAEQFVKVREWLAGLNIPVPEIHRLEGLWFLLQDLGDVTFERWLGGAPDTRDVDRRYATLIEYIERIRSCRNVAAIAGQPVLDAKFLDLELTAQFDEHAVKPLGRAAPDGFYAKLAAAAALGTPVPAHRDFHSRNVMVHDGKLWFLDFQDARLGSPCYDLASLAGDAYVNVPAAIRQHILDRATERGAFDAALAQRSLKAIGTFTYQHRIRKNDFYLRFIPRCARNAADALDALGWTSERNWLNGAVSDFSRTG